MISSKSLFVFQNEATCMIVLPSLGQYYEPILFCGVQSEKLHPMKIFFLAVAMTSTTLSFGQVSGNQVYSNSHSNGNYGVNYQNGGSIQSTDKTLTITSKVLLNDVADAYLLTVGLNQEATTVKECNELINERIDNALAKLRKLGIKEEDSYVDFITQTKVYDYDVNLRGAEQIQTGFEIKKNINLYFKDLSLIDQIVEICATEEIYDIINVEYLIEDINAVYNRLFDEAMKVAESRKAQFEKHGSKPVSDKYQVVSDQFNSIFPKTQYRQYEAKESSSLNVYNNNSNSSYVRKEARKNKTYYYQGVSVSAFDKVIGMANPKIGVQFTMTLTIVYQLNN